MGRNDEMTEDPLYVRVEVSRAILALLNFNMKECPPALGYASKK